MKEYQGKDANLFFVGFWTDKGDCDARIAGLLSGLHEKRVALFGTCGMGADESYYDQIAGAGEKWLPADNIYLGCFFCQGKMPMQVRNRYESLLDGSDRDIHIRLMIRNFDEAMLHPDRKDMNRQPRGLPGKFLKRKPNKLKFFRKSPIALLEDPWYIH